MELPLPVYQSGRAYSLAILQTSLRTFCHDQLFVCRSGSDEVASDGYLSACDRVDSRLQTDTRQPESSRSPGIALAGPGEHSLFRNSSGAERICRMDIGLC